MFRTTLRSLRAHGARLVFSSLAIILGVGFAAGTFVLTDTIQHGYRASFAADAQRLDVVAEPKGAAGGKLPAGLLDDVRDTTGVGTAQARYQGYGQLLDEDGRPAGGGQGFAQVDTVAAAKSLRWQEASKGRLPAADDELVLDAAAAKRFGFGIDETVRLVDADDEVRSYTLVGLMDLENSPQYAGAPYAGVTASQAKLLAGVDAKVRIDVLTASGSSAGAVERDIATTLPGGWRAYTSDQYTEKQLEAIASELTQLRTGLLAFAGIALFVAAIVIANTFTILIAQRTREMALLRCVGATRGQVYRSVVFESAVLGMVGSALGLVAGIGLAALAQTVLGSLGAPVPDGPVAPTLVGLAVPFALGTIVTVAAAAFPAIGATRIAPIAALRNQPPAERVRKTHRIRAALALLAVLAGCAAMVPGVTGDGGESEFLLALGGGAVAFLGILFITPVLVPGLIRVVGWLLALPFRTPGRLARANAVRNPGRAAATSAALLVGVTLISIMTVVSASVQETATASLDDEFPYDLTVTARDQAVPASVLDELRGDDRLSAVVPIRATQGELDGTALPVQGVDKAQVEREFGSLGAFDEVAPGKVVLPKEAASKAGVAVGDEVTVAFAGDERLRVTVADTTSGGNAVVASGALRTVAPDASVGSMYLEAAADASAEDVQTAVDDAVAGHPQLAVDGPLQYRAAIEQGIEITLLLFAGLLGVAVLIALFGIANTLALSVLERTRESGVLRALGLTRGQLRGMLSGEAALLAAVAGLLGVGLGVGFGFVAVASLIGRDTAELVVPYDRLATFVAVAAVAGLVASVLPARKAARSSAVAAMAEE
ncbi:MAG: FtsX-like permease family protein [Streptosporangiales bacterium]|nr:FtsX-like permease family protein [Streptosporangiales bacterium]